MPHGIRGYLIAQAVLERQASSIASTRATEIDRARRHLTAWRRSTWLLGPASSLRTLLESGAAPLFHSLGFESPTDVLLSEHMALSTIDLNGHQIVAAVAAWGDRLDGLWRAVVVEARRRGARWALLFNGTDLRVLDAASLQSRRFVEFDLDAVLDDEQGFASFWTVVRPEAFHSNGGSWVADAIQESERHAAAVCRSLRRGVLQASGEVLNAFSRLSRFPLHDAFSQSLTIVYRILFLLFAEARGLVPLWHPIYRESYSIEALREAAERRPPVLGMWEALQATCRLAHAGCRAGDLQVTAFNGRLFAPSATPLAERSGIDDHAAQRAVLALSTRSAPDRAGTERIAYHELGVEQLGAVYESLLDYEPKRRAAAAANDRRPAETAAPIVLVSGSERRKRTGTFYTPQPLAQYLVRQTLGPLVRDRSPEEVLALRVLDPAMGSGAFLVAACDYLASAYSTALIEAGRCHPSDLSPVEQRLIRRTVAERCLFGVDLNPMATQLARLSIWLTSLAADRPLSFLDHHLTSGDSLLGTWLTCLRRAPASLTRRSDRALPLFDDEAVQSVVRAALPVRFNLADGPNDTAEQVHGKERALAALNRPDSMLSRWRRIADLWCSHWFSAGVPSAAFGALSDAIRTGEGALPGHTERLLLDRAADTASRRRFFHWELEFPEVFFDAAGTRLAAGGFDAVLGNPPWDMLRADAGDAENRARARTDESGVVRFARDAGVYEASATGHANRYQLFVERAVRLTKPLGRVGLVLPSGIATDHGSSALRRLLFSRCAVESLVGFDNRLGVFPIHRSVRFVLMTAAVGSPTTNIACRLGETSLTALDAIDGTSPPSEHFPVRVTPALLERLSGPALAIPDLRTPVDLVIAERSAALFPAAGDTRGWGLHFGRELNATDDRDCLQPGHTRRVPVVEGKQLSPFAVHLAGARWTVRATDATARLGDRWRRRRLAYRDVASASNRLTLIAAMLPPGCVSTHTVFCLRTPVPIRLQLFLCGLFNSLVVNYLTRLRVTTHVTTAIVEHLPIPREDQAGGVFEDVIAISRQLSAGLDADALARLNAIVARLYQLSEAEFRHVLGTFPLVDATQRASALAAFLALTG